VTLTSLLAEHSGATIAAAVGDRVRVQLDENPTTGYRWQPLAQSSVLDLVSDEFVPAGDGGIGAGGTRTLEYEAIAAGRGSLKLGLTRAWEPEREPLHTFGFALEIGVGRSTA
jgi:inhibitor of cysteine peptidase